MSTDMYKLMHGRHPTASVAIAALGLDRDDIPRFRDAWILDGTPLHLVVLTRSGGGNRAYFDSMNEDALADSYEGPFNATLRAHTQFIREHDDIRDNTYALFWFSVPPAWLRLVNIVAQYDNKQVPLDETVRRLRELDALENKAISDDQVLTGDQQRYFTMLMVTRDAAERGLAALREQQK
ncbi:MAG: hypothetical protein V6Z86_05580 [Hyphomicrobiales bacterium]